jgi:hypothetical protein
MEGKECVGKPQVKTPLGKSGHTWEDNITVRPGERDWTDLAQDRGRQRVLVNFRIRYEN